MLQHQQSKDLLCDEATTCRNLQPRQPQQPELSPSQPLMRSHSCTLAACSEYHTKNRLCVAYANSTQTAANELKKAIKHAYRHSRSIVTAVAHLEPEHCIHNHAGTEDTPTHLSMEMLL